MDTPQSLSALEHAYCFTFVHAKRSMVHLKSIIEYPLQRRGRGSSYEEAAPERVDGIQNWNIKRTWYIKR